VAEGVSTGTLGAASVGRGATSERVSLVGMGATETLEAFESVSLVGIGAKMPETLGVMSEVG
jgi:hypothetical protein